MEVPCKNDQILELSYLGNWSLVSFTVIATVIGYWPFNSMNTDSSKLYWIQISLYKQITQNKLIFSISNHRLTPSMQWRQKCVCSETCIYLQIMWFPVRKIQRNCCITHLQMGSWVFIQTNLAYLAWIWSHRVGLVPWQAIYLALLRIAVC